MEAAFHCTQPYGDILTLGATGVRRAVMRTMRSIAAMVGVVPGSPPPSQAACRAALRALSTNMLHGACEGRPVRLNLVLPEDSGAGPG